MTAMPSRLLSFVAALAVVASSAHAQKRKDGWIAAEQPLPLSVKTAQDLKLKASIERQYLIFNLLGQGKVSYDKGDFADAARRWEELLKLPEVDSRLAADLKPWAAAARAKAGGSAAADTGDPSVPPTDGSAAATTPAGPDEPAKPTTVTVTGTVSGGEGGPGGAVVTLKRSDGTTPKVRPAKNRAMLQKDKAFAPHVLVVPAGSNVAFKNMDPIFHNVFSLSPAKKFDSGFHKAGGQELVKFDKPGVVEVLCNIHASMQAYVVVVDTPYHAIASASGAFTIKNVPPGEYDVEVWHESASVLGRDKLKVGDEGGKLSLTVGADKRRNAVPLDKYGKPRQPQLGY